jgi:hypothetical protein
VKRRPRQRSAARSESLADLRHERLGLSRTCGAENSTILRPSSSDQARIHSDDPSLRHRPLVALAVPNVARRASSSISRAASGTRPDRSGAVLQSRHEAARVSTMSARGTEEQIIAILKKHGAGNGYLCLKRGIREECFYSWNAKYGAIRLGRTKWTHPRDNLVAGVDSLIRIG